MRDYGDITDTCRDAWGGVARGHAQRDLGSQPTNPGSHAPPHALARPRNPPPAAHCAPVSRERSPTAAVAITAMHTKASIAAAHDRAGMYHGHSDARTCVQCVSSGILSA